MFLHVAREACSSLVLLGTLRRSLQERSCRHALNKLLRIIVLSHKITSPRIEITQQYSRQNVVRGIEAEAKKYRKLHESKQSERYLRGEQQPPSTIL